ncbi:MAG: FHA domain-containing protein [Gemmatales bacterium]|nr:FHA domain-containing protein [Gemmatales bacterium]MDW8385977.1 FHA domain-containing protein [Gemmatales bacterium]
MKLSLVVLQGKPEGKEIPIRLSQFLIGRDPECHLRPSSPLVSKRHAAVLIRDNKAFVRDFGSTNGTFVNKQPVKGEVELKDGDELTVGPLSFRVKLSVTAQETPKPAAVTPTEKAAAAAKPAPAGKKPEAKPGGKSTALDDEESVLELLLNLEGDASGGVTSGADPIPGGSTIMQMMAAGQSEETTSETPGEETKPPEKKPEKYKPKVSDPQATANAAKAILEKYMRRPRT